MRVNPVPVGSLVAVPSQAIHQREHALPFWCLMFFTFVLFVAPQGIFPSLAPLRLARVSAGLATVVYILDRLRAGGPLIVVTPEVRLVGSLVVLAVVSIPFSSWPGGAFDYLLSDFLKSVIIFLLLTNVVHTVRRLKLLTASIILWGSILSLQAINDFRLGNFLKSDRVGHYTAPVATDPNDLALTLNLILALTIGFYFATTRRLSKTLLLAVMALFAVGVIVTFSRGGALALFAILVVFLIKRARERGLAAVSLLLILLLLAMPFLPHGYTDRLYSIYDTSSDSTGSANARFAGLILGVQLMLENPLVGLGLNMHGLSFPERGLGWQGIHNAFIQVGADLGLPAFVIFLLLNWRLLRGVRRSQTRLRKASGDRELLGLGAGIEIALIAFVVGGCMLPAAYHFHFYYPAGFAVAFNEIAKHALDVQRVTGHK